MEGDTVKCEYERSIFPSTVLFLHALCVRIPWASICLHPPVQKGRADGPFLEAKKIMELYYMAEDPEVDVVVL